MINEETYKGAWNKILLPANPCCYFGMVGIKWILSNFLKSGLKCAVSTETSLKYLFFVRTSLISRVDVVILTTISLFHYLFQSRLE